MLDQRVAMERCRRWRRAAQRTRLHRGYAAARGAERSVIDITSIGVLSNVPCSPSTVLFPRKLSQDTLWLASSPTTASKTSCASRRVPSTVFIRGAMSPGFRRELRFTSTPASASTAEPAPIPPGAVLSPRRSPRRHETLQSRLARAIYKDHIYCIAAMTIVLVLQLGAHGRHSRHKEVPVPVTPQSAVL